MADTDYNNRLASPDDIDRTHELVQLGMAASAAASADNLAAYLALKRPDLEESIASILGLGQAIRRAIAAAGFSADSTGATKTGVEADLRELVMEGVVAVQVNNVTTQMDHWLEMVGRRFPELMPNLETGTETLRGT